MVRRRVNSLLFVCKNKMQAAKLGIHPEVDQVWCRGMNGGDPYFVHAIHAGGWPRQPHEIDVVALQRMSTQTVVGGTGHRSWLEEMERGWRDNYDRAEERFARSVARWFGPGGEGRARAKFLIKNQLGGRVHVRGRANQAGATLHPKKGLIV